MTTRNPPILPRVHAAWDNFNVTLTANKVAPATAAKPSRSLTDQTFGE